MRRFWPDARRPGQGPNPRWTQRLPLPAPGRGLGRGVLRPVRARAVLQLAVDPDVDLLIKEGGIALDLGALLDGVQVAPEDVGQHGPARLRGPVGRLAFVGA